MMYTGSFMKVRGFSRFLASTSLVAMGSVVMMTSLQSQHVKSTFAASSALPPESQTAGHGVSRLFDRKMPGALPYLVERGQDRLAMYAAPQEDQPRLLLELARERVQAAEYALNKGEESQAMTTLSKAFVYLHRAVALCNEQGEGCQASSEQFSTVGEAFQKTCLSIHHNARMSDIRARAQGLCSELEAVLSSFISTT